MCDTKQIAPPREYSIWAFHGCRGRGGPHPDVINQCNLNFLSNSYIKYLQIVSSSMVLLLALHIIAFMFPEQLTVFVLMDPRSLKEFTFSTVSPSTSMTESTHRHFRSSFIQSPRSAVCCRFIRKLMALAFVPIVSLRPAFIALSLDPVVARIPGIAPLLVYYEQTCLNGDFPIQMWNVFSQSIRTNNRVERWHHKLNRAIGQSNPNTHELISVLKKEQTITEEILQRARLGAPPPHAAVGTGCWKSGWSISRRRLDKAKKLQTTIWMLCDTWFISYEDEHMSRSRRPTSY